MIKRICVFAVCLFVLLNVAGCGININIDNGRNDTENTGVETDTNQSKKDDANISDLPGKDKEHIEPETKVDEPAEEKIEESHIVNILPTMSYDERYEINIFLSNFSEAMYGTVGYGEAEDMISFAYTHNCLNNKNFKRTVTDGKYGIPASLVNTTLSRFFGKTVPLQTPVQSIMWVYENGEFRFPAADGESHAYFTTATEVFKRADGFYDVAFEVYFNANDPHGDINKQWYGMTAPEASQYFEFCYNGAAVLEPVGDTYRLVSYMTN